jgi:hypothetical protein
MTACGQTVNPGKEIFSETQKVLAFGTVEVVTPTAV